MTFSGIDAKHCIQNLSDCKEIWKVDHKKVELNAVKNHHNSKLEMDINWMLNHDTKYKYKWTEYNMNKYLILTVEITILTCKH